MATSHKPIALEIAPVTPSDIPTLVEIWFAAFNDPALRRLWPDTPGVRGWLNEAARNDLEKKPFQKYIKVVDTEANCIVAYAKWDLSTPEERGKRYPPWHEDMAAAESDALVERGERERTRLMTGVRHYFLSTIATHPDHQRRGAASMLLQWGCDMADEAGVALYVDASKAGAPLYQRFGFVDESGPDAGESASMVRARRAR